MVERRREAPIRDVKLVRRSRGYSNYWIFSGAMRVLQVTTLTIIYKPATQGYRRRDGRLFGATGGGDRRGNPRFSGLPTLAIPRCRQSLH